MKNHVVDELNKFLEGNFMAIHAYENYIHHIDDQSVKEILQKLQQEHKHHATMIAERIQDLGGVPVDHVGFGGTIAEFVVNLKGATTDRTSILKDALVGESRGIKKSKELLNGDLDPQSLELVKNILNNDQQHLELLDQLIQKYE
ncbi:DUF2383 domain-containing protein [Desertibacillus haloalkaliphilus]|uniref:DUF2383 domain-containing protein n=1 Tax=Desertibacillus haloalkaliphilus TaxID=1328930 RepID=UPI001C27EDA3|nr:DUF2383 domain-containing protein [Desertibacillus haloalkaliphilus]MBU8908791.1 PA2169 family four-helix-bundle protein [Desertibacillus haloalkaliphilus]